MTGNGKKMRFKKNKYPRAFVTGIYKKVTIKDMGKVYLAPDEQLTFITENKKEYDLCRKNWGFYATPSTNFRLKKEGFKTAVTKNFMNRIYVMIIDKKHMLKYKKYCKDHKIKVLFWLDNYIK